jgi:tetratricopeptide (TPR) repeat protein
MRLPALRLVGVALLFALAGPSRTAVAAEPTPPAAPPADLAREHYERGLAKYNLAEFDAAIVEFKQSYELSKAPRLLFNIAQAYRLKKDYASALYFYNTYLRADPNPPNLDDVEAKIDEMKRALDDERKNAVAKPSVVEPPPPPPHVDRRPSKRTLKIAGVAVGALGLASCAVGGGMLGLSASDASKIRGVVRNGMTWTAADQATYDQGGRANTAGVVLLSAGGALVVAGGITLIAAARR